MTNQPPAKPPRVWFIQKPIAHNCPVGQFGPLESQAAVFQDFMPTVSLQKHEWVPVVERSAYDQLKRELSEATEMIDVWKSRSEINGKLAMKMQDERDRHKRALEKCKYQRNVNIRGFEFRVRQYDEEISRILEGKE